MKIPPELPEPVATLITKSAKALRRCVADRLRAYGDREKRVSRDTSDAYIERVLEEVGVKRLSVVRDEATLLDLLQPAIILRIDTDECEIARIIEETNWGSVSRVVIAISLNRHGRLVDQFGKDTEDYYYDAVTLLLNRRRHYPFYKGLLLTKFLIRTVDNLCDHARKLAAKNGQRLSLVSGPPGATSPDEYSEDLFVSPEASREDELVAKANLELFLSSLRDPALYEYARRRILDPHGSAADLAAALGITVPEVRKLQRRLERRIRGWNGRWEELSVEIPPAAGTPGIPN
jgi:hypothetical protein